MSKKVKLNYIKSGRVLATFNTGTKEHSSLKDYTRKAKHKKRATEERNI